MGGEAAASPNGDFCWGREGGKEGRREDGRERKEGRYVCV